MSDLNVQDWNLHCVQGLYKPQSLTRKNNEPIKAPVSVVGSWMITIRNIMMSGKTDCGGSTILAEIDHILWRGRIIVSSLNSGVSMTFPWTIYLIFWPWGGWGGRIVRQWKRRSRLSGWRGLRREGGTSEERWFVHTWRSFKWLHHRCAIDKDVARVKQGQEKSIGRRNSAEQKVIRLLHCYQSKQTHYH